MQPTMCSRCHKNVAVVFVQRIENGETVTDGLCISCARELGIKPVDDMIQKMGLSEDDVQNLTDEMMSAFGGAEGMEGMMSPAKDEDDEERIIAELEVGHGVTEHNLCQAKFPAKPLLAQDPFS